MLNSAKETAHQNEKIYTVAAKTLLLENHKFIVIGAHFYLETFSISRLLSVRYGVLLIYYYFIRRSFFQSHCVSSCRQRQSLYLNEFFFNNHIQYLYFLWYYCSFLFKRFRFSEQKSYYCQLILLSCPLRLLKQIRQEFWRVPYYSLSHWFFRLRDSRTSM